MKLINKAPHVRKIPNYAGMISYPELYIKKDDTINDIFGGTMSSFYIYLHFFLVRKLEFILGYAKHLNC